jgi:hypothetical protein
MRKLHGVLAVTVLALFAGEARAQGVDALDAAIAAAAAVAPGDAQAYVAARAKVLAAGEASLPALIDRAGDARFTSDGWKAALVAEACRVRLEHPEVAAQVDAPRGIDPAVYRKFRKPEPHCQADLARLGRDAVPLVLERRLWTLDDPARPFSEGAAGAAEREALAFATVFVPGAVGDARARFALADAIRDASLSLAARREAAVSYGACAGAEAIAPLGALVDDATQPVEVREGAAWGLGRVPTAAAADALLSRLAKATDARLARALEAGAGVLADKWGWEARGADAATAAKPLRARCGLALVDALRARPADRDVIGPALSQAAAPEAIVAVRALASDSSAPAEAREAAGEVLPVLEIAAAREK